ncbi:MAG TPA: hypothetical protein VN962_25360, partial [Polyangia bacterium]|nr:hypothetical protein [Polyangia bacterium]
PVVTENVRHALPALLSFFVPTLGQLIKGDVLTALAILGIFCGIMLVAFAGLAIFAPFAAFILWVWQIYDAYSAPDGETKRELKRLGRR